MVAGSQPLAAPDNLMDGAPEERSSSRRSWKREGRGGGSVRGQWEKGGGEKQQKNKTQKRAGGGKKI